MESLRWDVTPPGLHYLLIHYDIPLVDATTWRLTLGGCVRTPLSFSLDDLAGQPQHTVCVTLECAGNGRAQMSPRPVSQPWLNGAVGTADWTGVRLKNLLSEAGMDPKSTDVLFTGSDHGLERGVEQDYARGRAWSGWAPVEGVEVSADDGLSWAGAALGPDHGRWAWRGFDHVWDALPGQYVLRVRARDQSGRVQPDVPLWNRGGFANNADQPVELVVLDVTARQP